MKAPAKPTNRHRGSRMAHMEDAHSLGKFTHCSNAFSVLILLTETCTYNRTSHDMCKVNGRSVQELLLKASSENVKGS